MSKRFRAAACISAIVVLFVAGSILCQGSLGAPKPSPTPTPKVATKPAPSPTAKPDPKPAAGGQAAIVPGELSAVPTIECIGVRWDVSGDFNGNATGKIEFRAAGETSFKQAFGLHRKPLRTGTAVKFRGSIDNWSGGMRDYAADSFKMNYLAGSIFGLKPATQYEIKVTLTDPDGGGTSKTITVKTRPLPDIPKTGRVIDVKGGGDALKKAAEAAAPGDIINVHAGKYNGGIVLTTNGTPDKPISIRSAGDGEVLLSDPQTPAPTAAKPHDLLYPKSDLNGIAVKAAHVRIDGLSFYNFKNCVRAEKQADDLAVTHCKMNHFYTAITSAADNGYFADNSMRGSFNALDPAVAKNMRNEGHGIEFYGLPSGNVMCYNEISLVADGIRAHGQECDVYGNDVIFNVDDGIELDDGGPNLRVFDNRWSFTGENGLSFQPYIGGPAYLVRNLVMGQKEGPLKNRYDSDGAIFINNTLVSNDRQDGSDVPFGSLTRNNLFLGLSNKTQTAKIDVEPQYLTALDMDYDGFVLRGPNRQTVKDFSAKTGLEKHGLQFDASSDVVAKQPVFPKEYDSGQWEISQAYLNEKGRPHPDLSLKSGSPAIGAGVPVPNIMERADGKKPDLGALQFGQPAPHYGPRTERK